MSAPSDKKDEIVYIHPLARPFLWIDNPSVRHTAGLVLGAFAIVLGLLDFVFHRETHFEFEAFPGFFAFAGFGFFCLAVAGGLILRKFVMRPEDYYDEEDGHE